MTNTRQFQVLTSSASNQADIFNNLVEVKDVITGEVGLLLCSHMCQWPEELLSQATWIEGCKTPEIYANDTRLAMGYHPDQYTQWRVFKESNTIELYLTGGWTQHQGNDQWEEEVCYTSGLHYDDQPDWPIEFDGNINNKDIRRILRIFSRKTREGFQEALNFVESVIHRLVNSGAITAAVAAGVPYYLTKSYPDEVIHWEGLYNLFSEENCQGGTIIFDCINLGRNPLSVRTDGTVHVVFNYHDTGYACAIPFPTQRNEDGELEVISNILDEGFQRAVDFECSSHEENGEWYIKYIYKNPSTC